MHRPHPTLRLAATLTLTGLAVATPCALTAQSAQPYAAQLSAMFTTIAAGTTTLSGAGVELQQRFNRVYASEALGAFSIGIGAQYTVHVKVQDRLKIAGAFLEPRWVPPLGSGPVFPYLSARLAALRLTGEFRYAEGGSSNGGGFGAGGGVAIRVSRAINIDAGAQLVRQRFGTLNTLEFRPFTTYAAKVGVSVGYAQ